ncbi:MAG: hypothetical protein ABIG85_04225 [Chloroflexota bacterium]
MSDAPRPDEFPATTDPLGDRLREALEPADHLLPTGLLDQTLSAVRATRQARRSDRLVLLGAAAVILAVAGVGMLAVALPPGSGPAAQPSASPAAGTPYPTAPTYPTQAFGRAVLSVARALELRDAPAPAAGAASPSIAVAGWYAPAWPASCPYPGPVDQLESRCPAMFGWLMEQPEDLLIVTSNSATGRSPTGPAFNPRFLPGVPDPEVPAPPVAGPFPDPSPIPVVFVGHWHDPRAAFCTDEAERTCAREFVVEGTAWVDGEAIDPVTGTMFLASGGPPQGAATLATEAYPGWEIASMTFADVESWPDIDPRVIAAPDLPPGGAAWFVRLVSPVGAEPGVTVVILDRSDRVRALPAWPVRISSGERVPATVTTDAASVELRCDGVEVEECRAAATLARRADPAWFAGVDIVVVVPAGPAGTTWPEARGRVIIAAVRTGSQGSLNTDAYLARVADGAREIQPLPAWASLPHLSAAVMATQADE